MTKDEREAVENLTKTLDRAADTIRAEERGSACTRRSFLATLLTGGFVAATAAQSHDSASDSASYSAGTGFWI